MRAAGAHSNAEGGAAAASSGDISGPEERLAFALSDGRVGVLAVKGRKVCGLSDILRTYLTYYVLRSMRHNQYAGHAGLLHSLSVAAHGACPHSILRSTTAAFCTRPQDPCA